MKLVVFSTFFYFPPSFLDGQSAKTPPGARPGAHAPRAPWLIRHSLDHLGSQILALILWYVFYCCEYFIVYYIFVLVTLLRTILGYRSARARQKDAMDLRSDCNQSMQSNGILGFSLKYDSMNPCRLVGHLPPPLRFVFRCVLSSL